MFNYEQVKFSLGGFLLNLQYAIEEASVNKYLQNNIIVNIRIIKWE